MLFSALSKLFFLQNYWKSKEKPKLLKIKITENPKKNHVLYLPILLVNSDISFKKCLP